MMKKLSLTAGILGMLAFLAAPPTGAQPQTPPAAPKAAKLYNPQAVVTLAGKVTAVNRRAPRKAGRPERVIMVLQTDQGAVKVHLGPANYFDQQALKLAPGDQVEVKGIKVNRPKAATFIAGQVRKGGQVMQLRDEATGRPLWLKGKKGHRET
jgi:hypothetical protein